MNYDKTKRSQSVKTREEQGVDLDSSLSEAWTNTNKEVSVGQGHGS